MVVQGRNKGNLSIWIKCFRICYCFLTAEYLSDIELLPIIGKLHPSGHLWKTTSKILISQGRACINYIYIPGFHWLLRAAAACFPSYLDPSLRITMDSHTYTVEHVFEDFKGRRAGLIKALTTDADDFYKQCDPDKENLCLYGFPDEEWKVNLPGVPIPSELPEPSLGINFARPGMQKTDWLSLVAAHSDSWLFGVAFYYVGQYRFNKSDRERLFSMINELPTILEVVDAAEVVTDAAKKQVEENSSVSNHSGSKCNPNSIADKIFAEDKEEEPKEEEDDDENILCNICSMHYGEDSFWIFCDFCDNWFHGKCVKVTPSMAEGIKKYRCPFCQLKFS